MQKVQEEDPLERRQKIIEGWKNPVKKERKKTILVIDDMLENLRAVKAVLEDQYEVRVARSSEFAQGILHNIFIDLILLDIEMPGESGSDYLERLKTDPVTQHVPVMFLTAHAESDVVSHVSHLDIKGYIKKPVDLQILKHKIHDVLNRKEVRDEGDAEGGAS
jgi:putative two-component system response regulator